MDKFWLNGISEDLITCTTHRMGSTGGGDAYQTSEWPGSRERILISNTEKENVRFAQKGTIRSWQSL